MKTDIINYVTAYDTNKQIVNSINKIMSRLDNNEYACIRDGDVIFLTSNFGHLINDVVKKYPDCDLFSCYTNRIGNPNQILPNAPTHNDIEKHREIAKKLSNKYWDLCEPYTDKKPLYGMLLLIKKKNYIPLEHNGILAIDNKIFNSFKNRNLKIMMIKGLYVYHYYRNGNKDDKSHLL